MISILFTVGEDMNDSIPRIIKSLLIIVGLTFVSYLLLHPPDVKVEVLCNFNIVSSCGSYKLVPEFECGTTADPDLQCHLHHCDAGGDMARTLADCCFTRGDMPAEWTVQLDFMFNQNPPVATGDYCCCDPEMVSEPSGGDDEQTDAPATTGGDPTEPANNDDEQTDTPAATGGDPTELANNDDDTVSGGRQYFLNVYQRTIPEAEITAEDRRVCQSLIPYSNGDCTDPACQIACSRREEEVGQHAIHVCLNVYKCCCDYDAARNLVTPYDGLYPPSA